MTVCIAAVCHMNREGGPLVVTASDRMITIGGLEYEPEQTKTVFLASRTVALFAGDMQLHATAVPKALEGVRKKLADIAPAGIPFAKSQRFMLMSSPTTGA